MGNNDKDTQTVPSGPICQHCGQRHQSGEDACLPPGIPLNLDKLRGGGILSKSVNDDGLIGKTIADKYEIVALVGKGGMSIVYKAIQHPINRVVAVKMLLAHLSKEEMSVKRFLQEAKATGQVNHQNVVSIFDFGIALDQQPFLVMDFVEGESLSDLLQRRQRLPYKEAIDLFSGICDGLAAVHKFGIIHRDIKPSNIVLQTLPDGIRVRIVDFGIAKMIDAESQHLTKTGEVFGSPYYMSPEQCYGKVLDARSDIYSLGVMLYEILAGRCPLVGATALDTMRLHMEEIPVSLQNLLGPEQVPIALENIVFKMLEKDREKRYASVLDLKHDLEEFQSGESKALSGNLQYVGREISRKSRAIKIGLGATAIFALVAVLAVFAYPSACSALAKNEFEKGFGNFQKNKLQEAERSLSNAAELSRKVGDIPTESRSLAVLVKVYRKLHDETRLEAVRLRRQQLIRDQLSQFDIDKVSINQLVASQISKSENLSRAVADQEVEQSDASLQAPEPQSAALTDGASPVRQRGAGSDSDDSEKIAFAHPSSPVPVTLPVPTPVPKFKPLNSSSQLPTPTPIPTPTPTPVLRRSVSGQSSLPLPTNSPNPVRATDQADFSSSPNRGLSINTPSLKTMSRSVEKGKAGSVFPAGGGGSSAIKQGSVDLDGSAPDATSKKVGLLNGQTNGSIGPQSADSLVHMQPDPDVLDNLEALLDTLIESGKYHKTIECSNKAIVMYNALGYNSPNELAGLLTARAWARFNTAHPRTALADVRQALQLTQNRNTMEAAEAQIMAALANQRLGDSQVANTCFARVEEILKTLGSNSSVIVQRGVERFKQLSDR